MTRGVPGRVLITGGREVGGLSSFAEALAAGFNQLGIPSEVIRPALVLSRWRDMRDTNVLKILSTNAVFAVPFARRAICIAHGFPRADCQGWTKLLSIIGSLKLANLFRHASVVAVSHYAAIHLRSIFNVRITDVIHNPLRPLFLQPFDNASQERDYITYVGRLHPTKNLHRLLPIVHSLLREMPGLRVCIIGDGDERYALQQRWSGEPRFEFKGSLCATEVRAFLRRTRVFISGCETEALGISYLEAMSQGCAVVMPACGGGLEIAPHLIGSRIHLLPLSFNTNVVLATLRRSLSSESRPISFASHSAEAIAAAYLATDSLCFSPQDACSAVTTASAAKL